MKFKAPGRPKRKKNKSNATEEEVTAALAEQETPAVEQEASQEQPEQQEPSEPINAAEETQQETTEETEQQETAESLVADNEAGNVSGEEQETWEEAPEITGTEPTESYPEIVEPAATEDAATEPDPVAVQPSPVPTVEVTDEDCNEDFQLAESHEEEEEVSVELSAVPPLFGILKKGPYMVPNASPKLAKTLKKQKWSTQFCRIDPALFQIFCCDKDRGKLYETQAPVETDGKCMFFHIGIYTSVTEGIEEDSKAKEFTFKITGLNGGPDNTLTLSTSTPEEREKWCKTIRRSVNRIHIDQDRLGDHTKLRKMLTGQEAEISILEEELEKMAVVTGECAGRASIAEEKLKLVERELAESQSKLRLANDEVTSLRTQLAIMEERTRNLNILADDVNGVNAEEVEAAREAMQKERAERLKAIQLEVGGDEDYLEKYKKYLNLKRDAVLQKHGSQYSVNSLGIGQPKVSPSTANAPLALN
ncbi:hypothetical protein ACHWQZ_G000206 [Mnemiopsis leidyi]